MQSPRSDTSAHVRSSCSSLLEHFGSQAAHWDDMFHLRTDPAGLAHQCNCTVPPHGNTELVRFLVALRMHPYVRGLLSRQSLHLRAHGGCYLDRCFAVGLLPRPLRRLLSHRLQYLRRCGLLRQIGRVCMRCRPACCLFRTCLFPLPYPLHLDCHCPVLWKVFFGLRKCCPTLYTRHYLLPFLSLFQHMRLWPALGPGWG